MDLSVQPQDGVQVIRLRGDLKIGDPVDQLRATLEQLITAGEVRIVLDITEVKMIDSSGIGAIMRALASLKQRGGSLKLLNPSKFALQTLKIVGLLNLFEVYEDEKAAVASYS